MAPTHEEGDIPMKTIVNTKAIVNWKLLSLLFALSVVLHVIASATSPSHPLLSVTLALLESIGWICIGLIWVIALIKGIQQWGPNAWTKVWTGVHTHRRTKKAKTSDTFVPVEQLKYLRNGVQRLGLALHGMTSEMENARRVHFQMFGEAVPPLILPLQNALLYAEFESLVKMLNHFGFPSLESVRLQQRDLAFIQQWGSDLEARLWQQHQGSFEQQAAVRIALTAVTQQHKTLGETWALAHHHSGYQRIQGALWLLETMVSDNRCHWDLAQTYVQALQSDIETLVKHCEQAVV